MENKKDMDGVQETKSENNSIYSEEETRITCRKDLTPYFEAWDHTINKLHFSEVNKKSIALTTISLSVLYFNYYIYILGI